MTDLLGPYMPYINLASQLCLVFYVVFVVAIAFWMWRDAQRRGAMSWFWAIAALPFSVAAWAIYMIVRPPETLDDAHERELEIAAREAELNHAGAICPNCFKPVESDYLICPTCMKKLKRECSSCGRAIRTSWSVCPYCKERQLPSDRVVDEPSQEADQPTHHRAPSHPSHESAATAGSEA